MRRSEMTFTPIQGGTRPMGGYQPVMGPSSPAPAPAWQYQSMMPKQEPMDQDARNDSGLDSGSEIVSFSPDSNRSGNFGMEYSSRTSQAATSMSPSTYYLNSVVGLGGYAQQHSVPPHLGYNGEHNPLTPPDSEPMVSPRTSFGANRSDVPLQHNTPMPSTDEANSAQKDTDNPIKRLEKIFASSRKSSECSLEEEKSENDPEEHDEQGLRTPKINSHGKLKQFKCRQCEFVANTKADFWEHSRMHIKPDKQLTCPKCPFVTEYKHHLEYHIRNHSGDKPYKCRKCSYSCVNKSMLNSHSKSHSNVYQYRCEDCTYATKYCHSLKLHLRKYNHNPATVLDEGGSPNPRKIIDVYGTRRGPKVKQQEQEPAEDTQPMIPYPLSQMLLNASSQMQMPFPGFPIFNGFQGALPNHLLLQGLDRLMRARQEGIPATSVPAEQTPEVSAAPEMFPGFSSKSSVSTETSPGVSPVPSVSAEPHPSTPSMPNGSAEPFSPFQENESGVLDLSTQDKPSSKNRRKGPAFKRAPSSGNSSDDEDEERTGTTMFSTVEAIQDDQDDEDSLDKSEVNNSIPFKCQFCDMSFGDPIMYNIHIGYHGYNNPYTCNLCGQVCKDKVSFYLHLVRAPHP